MWNASLGKYDARPVTSRSRRNRLFIFFSNYFKHTALRLCWRKGQVPVSMQFPEQTRMPTDQRTGGFLPHMEFYLNETFSFTSRLGIRARRARASATLKFIMSSLWWSIWRTAFMCHFFTSGTLTWPYISKAPLTISSWISWLEFRGYLLPSTKKKLLIKTSFPTRTFPRRTPSFEATEPPHRQSELSESVSP